MNKTEIPGSKGFTKKGLVICVLFTWFGILMCNTVLARDEEALSITKIEQLMTRGSVESILREEYDSGLIQKVEYDRKKQKTNFNELVYQEHLKPKNRKPVLVFFYDKQVTKEFKIDIREAIIIKNIINKYHSPINYVSYDVSVEPTYKGKKEDGVFGVQIRKERIKGIPSLAIYSTFDLAKGETSFYHKEQLKQIDILRGGPSNNEVFNAWLKFVKYKWIPTNITAPNDCHVWRFTNSADEKKIIYN